MTTITAPALESPFFAHTLAVRTFDTDSTESPMENEMRLAPTTRGKPVPGFPLAARATGAHDEAQLDESAVLLQASVEARLALEAAMAASATALQLARSVSAQLDARMAQTATPPPTSFESAAALAALSPREKDVLALVAAGQSNRTIAETLYLSPNTIKTHVSSLLTKLQAETRVQLAVIAAQSGVALAGYQRPTIGIT